MDTKPVFHGSDIEKICSYYNLKKEDIVKFGANVNPLGLSPRASQAIASHVELLSSYPDREYTSLRNTISRYCNIPADFILPGNGSSELISLLIQERSPKHTLILGPTYSEYSRELSFSGSTQEYYHLQESMDFEPDIPDLCRKLEQGYDFLILCNPNNPTSSAISKKDLRDLIHFCAEKDIFVMIDELKSISTYKVYPAYANFILLKIQKDGLTSYDVFEACIKEGLMIRDCSSFQCLDGEFIRFCIMKPEDNNRLLKVLKTI